MNLATLLPFLAILACPIAMGVMMWMMNRKMDSLSSHSMEGDQTPTNSAERLAALRAQRQALEAEIAEVTRLVELEAQRQALLTAQAPAPDTADVARLQSAD